MLVQMQTKLTLTATAALGLAFLAGPAKAVTLDDALSAYRDNRVAEAETMLQEVATDPGASAADRAGAWRELGRIDWLIRGESDGADAALAQASHGQERCAALLLALRVFREAGAPQVGLDEAARDRGECTPAATDNLRVALARAHLAQARLSPGAAGGRLSAAAAELADIAPIARRSPSMASAHLSLALAQGDAAAALQAWRDYYWLDNADAPQALSTVAGRVGAIFESGLAVNATEQDRVALVNLLIRAGFAEDARLLAGPMSQAPRWNDARAYFSFFDTVRTETLRANREMAGGGPAGWYQQAITTALNDLIAAAEIHFEPSDDQDATLVHKLTAVAERYGLYGTLGQTSGYPSLHAGHLAQDEQLSVAQYGRSGQLRFVVLDNMLANGFESWLWDGWAEAGGWAGGGAIVQVRSAYTDGPLGALRRARPGATRDRFLAEIERASVNERAALGRDSVAELPATGDRLELQAIDRIAAGVGDDDAGFVASFWHETVHYSITLHEGRHVLDNADAEFSSEELEFRAKLSQIALSDYPRLGLANVVSSTIGDTPHGNANRRILEGYRAWMRAHRRDIAGFDRRQPTLAQLYLLTDDQMRAAARAMDPWAR